MGQKTLYHVAIPTDVSLPSLSRRQSRAVHITMCLRVLRDALVSRERAMDRASRAAGLQRMTKKTLVWAVIALTSNQTLQTSVLNHSTVDLQDFSRRPPDSWNHHRPMYFRTLIPNHPPWHKVCSIQSPCACSGARPLVKQARPQWRESTWLGET